MFDVQTAELLQPGSALIVGSVAADGTPHASRGWGLTVVPGSSTVRLLVDADDSVLLANLTATGAIAVSVCDVRTYRAVQLKGMADAPRPADDPADVERGAEHVAAFFTAIHATEGTPIELLERLAPAALAVCTITVTDVFEQTPGPSAGAPMTSRG